MTPLYRLPSPFAGEPGTVLLVEPPCASAGELRARLLDETYAKPFVIDDGERRCLYFNIRLMQSAMSLRAPNGLELRYTQVMMAFLLFHPRPRHILMIGLGGGSLVKFCHQRLPGTELTVVEQDTDVIALGGAFLLPPAGPRLRVVAGDGADFLKGTGNGIDVLLVDAFDPTGFAPALANHDFFATAFARLAANGILVVNLAGDPESYAGLPCIVEEVFAGRAIVVTVPEDRNRVLFAFKEHDFAPRWRWLHGHAKALRSSLGLDFPAFARSIESCSHLARAGRR